MNDGYDGLQQIIDETLGSMAAEAAGDFDPQGCNLAEFCRRTGLSRQRARTIKSNGFKVKPHGRLGLKVATTVLSGHTGFVDDQLRKGVTNSQVVFERLVGQGYKGGLTTVKTYMADHKGSEAVEAAEPAEEDAEPAEWGLASVRQEDVVVSYNVPVDVAEGEEPRYETHQAEVTDFGNDGAAVSLTFKGEGPDASVHLYTVRFAGTSRMPWCTSCRRTTAW